MVNHGVPQFIFGFKKYIKYLVLVLKFEFLVYFCFIMRKSCPLQLQGLIQGWGSKKRKKDSITFVSLFFANNMYLKQI